MSDKGNEKRSLLVNLSKKSTGYDTNSIVTSLGPHSPRSPSSSSSSNPPHPVTLNLDNTSQYSRMQKKRAAPRIHQQTQHDDDESNCF